MNDNFEMEEIKLVDLKSKLDPRPFFSEESIQKEQAKTFSPNKLKELGHLDFPGIGPCITAVIYQSENDDVFALHIRPNETPELIKSKIESFINSHPQLTLLNLEYAVRKNAEPVKSYQGTDSVTGNKANIDFLADLDVLFPDQFAMGKIIYIETPNAVDNLAWNFADHFFILSHKDPRNPIS